MKRIFLLLSIVLGGLLLFVWIKNRQTNIITSDERLTKIRIGWQVPWATEGQLTQVLKHTDLLKENNLEGEFNGFDFGAPLNEAAVAGEVDVVFTADQPAATLLIKDPSWKIIGKLMYNRVTLYVPPESPITSVEQLKGKTVAMPFGAAAQRMALKAEEDAGLDPKKDVNNVNLGIYEQSDLVVDATAAKWGDFDAMAGFDPTPAIFEEKGLVRNIAEGKVVSVILMNTKYIEANPEAPVAFLRAFRDAYDYYRTNVNQADVWFTEEAKLDITSKALEISSSIEPNVTAASKSDIRIGFTDEDYQIMQEAADFIYDQGLVKSRVVMKDFVDTSYLSQI